MIRLNNQQQHFFYLSISEENGFENYILCIYYYYLYTYKYIFLYINEYISDLKQKYILR